MMNLTISTTSVEYAQFLSMRLIFMYSKNWMEDAEQYWSNNAQENWI